MVSRGDHGIQRVPLVCRIATQRINEIGNEIRAALELYVYAGPAFFGKLPRSHEAVVEMDDVNHRHNENGQDDKKLFHEMSFFVLAVTAASTESQRLFFSVPAKQGKRNPANEKTQQQDNEIDDRND